MSENLSLYQTYIYKRSYARWNEAEGRRETWPEIVARYMNFIRWHMKENCDYDMEVDTFIELRDAILSMNVVPSMRCMMTAGKALEIDNAAGFNCSATACGTR